MCTILVVIIVKIIFIHLILFYCLLCSHSFKTDPNTVTNLSKLFNYIAPTSLFWYIFRSCWIQKRIQIFQDLIYDPGCIIVVLRKKSGNFLFNIMVVVLKLKKLLLICMLKICNSAKRVANNITVCYWHSNRCKYEWEL